MNDDIPKSVIKIRLRDFLAKHPKLVTNIFGTQLQDDYEMSSLRSVRLPDEGWQALLLPSKIQSLDRTINLYEGTLWKDDCDWDGGVDWLAVILSVHWSRAIPYIFRVRVNYFKEEIAAQFRDEFVLKLLAATDVIVRETDGPAVAGFSDLLIDPEGRWGLIECQDEDYSLLLANGELFDRFVSAFGGMDIIRRRAEEHIRQRAGWKAKRHPRVSPDGLNEIYLSFFRSVYDRIGWPWPFADHITMEYFGLSDD